jgi:hypothetical protein
VDRGGLFGSQSVFGGGVRGHPIHSSLRFASTTSAAHLNFEIVAEVLFPRSTVNCCRARERVGVTALEIQMKVRQLIFFF